MVQFIAFLNLAQSELLQLVIEGSLTNVWHDYSL